MIITLAILGGVVCDVLLILLKQAKGLDFLWVVPAGFLAGMIVMILLQWLVIMIGAVFVKRKKEYIKPGKFYRFMIFRACELVLQLARCKVKVINKEALPAKDIPFVYVSNHQSNLDAVASAWYLRKYPLTFILKDNLLKIPFLKEYIHGWGALGLNRTSVRSGLLTIKKACDYITSHNRSIAVFPEGTRSKSYAMGPFHHGSFKIPLKSKCPLVVAAIQNGCMVGKRYPRHKTVLYVKIIKVFEYAEYRDYTSSELSDKVYNLIDDTLKELPKY